MKRITRYKYLDLLLVLGAVALSATLGYKLYPMRETWPGVPPTADEHSALLYGYGDQQLSYRNIGLMLQNAGDTGGRVTNFKDYDYAIIEGWLWLTNKLDSQSNYVPGLGAFYFGAAKEKKQLEHLVDYLAHVGMDNKQERWRWLAHAIYIARFQLDDQPRALKMAEQLASIATPEMPGWTKVMPAYVMKTMGNKKEARDMLLLVLADPKVLTDRADVNQSCWFINENLREPNDGMEQNEIYKSLCIPFLEEEKKSQKLRDKLKQKEAKKSAVVKTEAVPEAVDAGPAVPETTVKPQI